MPLILAYLKTFHNRANATLVPTRGLKEDLTKKGFRNLHVLGRGIDLTLFSPEQRSIPLRRNWGVENDSLAVLYVGRLAAEKNLQLAIKAFTRMQEANPAARFILVGDGPLRKKIAAERPDLIIAGPQTGRRLAKHYASADVFLFPSLTETFGNVTIEALASGLAVVAFDYAAAAEIGHHNINGLFVPYGSEDEFVAAAKRLAADNKLVEQLRHHARQSVKRFSWRDICERLESVLRSHIKNSQHPLHLEPQDKP